MYNINLPSLPLLFMSANFSTEREMLELFIAGLKVGVRGFDTAREYGVEKKVGRALRKALNETGIRREEVYVQTRVSNEEIILGHIEEELNRSVDALNMDYLDCFMFHWPTPDYFIKAWNALSVIANENVTLVHSIGICNCRLRHLEQMDRECVKMPDVLQVEVTPFWQANDLKDYCDQRHIKMQSFSPLCKMIEPICSNQVLLDLARKYSITIPQVILRWNLQRDISPISFSHKVSRVKSNFDVFGFELTESDMQRIALLDCGYKYHLESATCAGF